MALVKTIGKVHGIILRVLYFFLFISILYNMKQFIRRMLDPEVGTGAVDVYAWMFGSQFIVFIIILSSWSAFSSNQVWYLYIYIFSIFISSLILVNVFVSYNSEQWRNWRSIFVLVSVILFVSFLFLLMFHGLICSIIPGI